MSYPKIIERIEAGERVSLAPSGSSMEPRIHNKQEITLAPIEEELEIGDIVLAKVKGRYYIHLITAIDGDRIQISNNHGHVNGWTHRSKIYAKVDENG